VNLDDAIWGNQGYLESTRGREGERLREYSARTRAKASAHLFLTRVARIGWSR
jgi:hypothetical protein